MEDYQEFSKQFERKFFVDVAKFLLWFGGFWVIFTAVVMVAIEGKSYLQQPLAGLTAFASLIYVGQVFWRFQRDVQRKTKDSTYRFITSWKLFLADIAMLGGLTIYQFTTAFSSSSVFTATQFNSLSNVFLALIFHFFRFVYHMISTTKS